MVIGNQFYADAMAYYEANVDDGGELEHKVWDGTPFMVDWFTGPVAHERDLLMRQWCRHHIGDEAWPIHGKRGRWHRGGATVYGWTWFGFETQAFLDAFMTAWPLPDGVAPPVNNLREKAEQ